MLTYILLNLLTEGLIYQSQINDSLRKLNMRLQNKIQEKRKENTY